jgi:hypothetical protein
MAYAWGMDPFLDILPEIFQSGLGLVIFVILFFWSFVWKILALYRSASRKQKGWFVVLFFVNTAGLLEIIYLLSHRKRAKRA